MQSPRATSKNFIKEDGNLTDSILPRDDSTLFLAKKKQKRSSRWKYLIEGISMLLLAVIIIHCYLHTQKRKAILNSDLNYEIQCQVDRKSIRKSIMALSYLQYQLDRLSTKMDKIMERSFQTTAEKRKLIRIIHDKVQTALDVYDADKLGMRDYALESIGARIDSISSSTIPYKTGRYYGLFGIYYAPTSSPANVITSGTLPGQCFAFKGNKGRVRIKLAASNVQITAVTLEHASFVLLMDHRSAPKTFIVYGIDNVDFAETILGQFIYKSQEMGAKPLQTFPISNKTNKTFELVDLYIMDNYGNPEFTCVYRFRVHGILRSK